MKYLTFLTAFAVLSGCASTAPDPWAGLDTDLSAAASPIDCGGFPLPATSDDQSITYTKQGVNALDAYRACAEANAAIAAEHRDQIGQLKLARKGLTEAGQAQRRIADMKEEMLRDERRHNFFEKIGLYVLVIGLGASL